MPDSLFIHHFIIQEGIRQEIRPELACQVIPPEVGGKKLPQGKGRRGSSLVESGIPPRALAE